MRQDLVPPRAAEGRLSLTIDELADWGTRLGRQLRPPLVITLSGELGAGKTTLARAICEGYGVAEDVTSPTFAIVHTYEAPKSPVHHVDLYRIDGARDLQNIGWDELIASDAIVIVEWPERAGSMMPGDHVPIELSHIPDAPDRRLLYAGGHLGHETGTR